MFYWGKCDIKIIEKVTSGEIWKRGGREQMYVYYVVYEIIGKYGIAGNGSCEIILYKKITDYAKIQEIKNRLIENAKKKCPDLKDVLITNFILLRKEKKNEKNYTDEYTDNSNNNTNNS